MNNLLLAIVLLLSAAGCQTRNKVFNDRNLVSITVEGNYRDTLRASKRKINHTDSLVRIVRHFNNAKRQPTKFWPAYKISLIYNDGTALTIFALDSLIKYDGLTYTLNENIEQILGN